MQPDRGHLPEQLAIDRSVEQAARDLVKDGVLTEAAGNRIEMVIRSYDPCISCATHAIGRMPVAVEVRDAINIWGREKKIG